MLLKTLITPHSLIKEKTVRVLISITFILFVMSTLSLAKEVRDQGSEQLFLAHNIWKTPKTKHMKCINYKIGEIIPFGTEVINTKVFMEPDYGHNNEQNDFDNEGGTPKIRFTLKESKEKITISFVKNWHPGKTIYDYYDQMFTSKSFFELSYGLDEKKLEKARQGKLIVGMTKQEVLLTYGYPPEHKTKSLDESSWRYWINTLSTKEICFDDESKAMACGILEL
jgi:hypothetical protein